MIPNNHIIIQICTDVSLLHESMGTLRQLHESELAHLRTVSYRCLSRIHQILISSIPHILLSTESHADMSQLMYKLLRTVHQLQLPFDSPVHVEISQ